MCPKGLGLRACGFGQTWHCSTTGQFFKLCEVKTPPTIRFQGLRDFSLAGWRYPRYVDYGKLRCEVETPPTSGTDPRLAGL